MHLFAALFDRAASIPTSVFCHLQRHGETETITVAAICAAAGSIAARLRAAGVQPGQVVPIVLEHRADLYASFIGCTLLGALPSLLPPLTSRQDPELFAAAVAQLLARIDPPCVIASAATSATVALSGRPIINLDVPAPTSAPIAPPETAPTDAAFLQHSSGTTGLKKGVQISHGAALRHIAHYAAAIEATETDRIATWLPLYHDMGLITGFLLPAVLGLPIVSLDALEWVSRPTILLDAIAHHRATLCWLPNFAFPHIARMAPPEQSWDLTSLRLLVNCSEPCRAPAVDAFRTRFASSGLGETTIQASYAMAETVFAVTQSRPDAPARTSRRPGYASYLSCGEPIPGISLRIDGPEPGEIILTGDCLFDGYHHDPARTATRLRNGWYHTGDIGFLEDGALFVVGRLDDILIVNGRKLLAHEIEEGLANLPGLIPGRILACAPFGPEAGTGHLTIAAEADGIQPEPALAAAIRRTVLGLTGLRPHRVTLLPRGFLVKSTSGKISRAASLARLIERTEAAHNG